MTRLLAVITLAAAGCTPLEVAAVQHHTRLVHDMDRLAQCESGDTNDRGGPYYGHWQFSLPTWRSVGGSTASRGARRSVASTRSSTTAWCSPMGSERMPSQSDRLTEIRERWAKATPGPWRLDGRCVLAGPGYIVARARRPEYADAIAHAPDDIDFLLAEIERHRDIAAGLLEAPCGESGQ